MTDDGKFKRPELNPEMVYEVTFELDGFEKKTFIVKDLTAGDKVKLNVTMVKL